jgi:2,4-dichlorophenol 6-monooxygenase
MDVETDVLIVGSGPAGGAAALLLSTYGVDNIVVTKYGRLADTPRAHITNQRAMEVLRDAGIEDQVIAQATPQELMGDTVFCASLAGEELGRLRTWYTHPERLAEHVLATPTRICDMPQHLMEPVLADNAVARGTKFRFDTEYLSLDQDDDGVTATVRDRLRGDTYRIRAKYLIGADGGRSQVAQDIGLPLVGQMGVAGSINIVFEADLSHLVAHRPSILYWVLQTGSEVGGIGMGLVRCVRPRHEWLIVWGYDINGDPPDLTEEYARQIAHHLIGDETIPVTIKSSSAWTVNHLYAEHYQRGRVFCAGDAVHRHPPSNGLGSNTSIQDAYNLAWKLAYVLRGTAGEALLDTYDAERVPVGEQVVLRANKSIEEFGPIFDALGLTGESDPEVMRQHIAARAANTPDAARQRAELRAALELKNYEFNAHGVELGQRYTSTAVAPDGTPEPEYSRDRELYHHPTTWPGARLPHVWLGRDGRRVSTHDLAGKGRFCLLTGIAGEPWAEAAGEVADDLGVEVAAHVIGPGREFIDLYEDWAVAREVGEEGCVLVRPDAHVAWRSAGLVQDPAAELHRVLSAVLARHDGGGHRS